MHPWLVLLHVLGVLGFLLSHGASAAVMLKVRNECDVTRLRAFLDLSKSVSIATAVTAAVLFFSGIAAGFTGHLWGRGWIWASLGLFLAMSFAMSFLGRVYFERIRGSLGVAATGVVQVSATAAELGLPARDLEAVIASGHPRLLAGIGLGGLAVITWLMMFKPF